MACAKRNSPYGRRVRLDGKLEGDPCAVKGQTLVVLEVQICEPRGSRQQGTNTDVTKAIIGACYVDCGQASTLLAQPGQAVVGKANEWPITICRVELGQAVEVEEAVHEARHTCRVHGRSIMLVLK